MCDPAGGQCLEHPRPGCASWQSGCPAAVVERTVISKGAPAEVVALTYCISFPLLVCVSRLAGLGTVRLEVSAVGGPSLDIMLGLSRKDWPFLVMAQT